MPRSTLVPNQLQRERHGMKLETVSKEVRNRTFYNTAEGSTTEADTDTQQAFVDILDNDVIKPLEMLKASSPFVSAESSILTIGSLKRKQKIRQGSKLRKISRIPPRNTPIMRRTQS
jgi:hypothetical protein